MYGVPGADAPGSAETGPSGLAGTLGCRDQVLTHLALLRSALQAWVGCGLLGACVLFVPCLRLQLRPGGRFAVAVGVGLVITPFAAVVVRSYTTQRTKCSPSIPARPHPLRNTWIFKGDKKFVPGLKPRLRLLSLASYTTPWLCGLLLAAMCCRGSDAEGTTAR